MKKQILLCFLLLLVCQICYTQELTEEEQQQLKEQYFGNTDFLEGHKLSKEGRQDEGLELLYKAYDTFEAEKNCLALINLGTRIVAIGVRSKSYAKALALSDSLLNKLANEAPQYLDECFALYIQRATLCQYNGMPRRSLNACFKAVNLLKRLHESEIHYDYLDTYASIGYAYEDLGKLDSAAYFYQKFSEVIPQLDEFHPDQLGLALRNRSNIEAKKGNYGKAVVLIEEAIEYILMAYGEDALVLWKYYGTLGNYYSYLYEREKSLEQYKKILHILETEEGLPDVYYYNILPSLHYAICDAYLETDKIDKALYHFEQGKYYEQNEEEALEDNSYVSKMEGIIKMKQGDPIQALKCFKKAKQIIVRNKNRVTQDQQFAYDKSIYEIENDIASAYLTMEQLDSAALHLKEVIRIGEDIFKGQQGTYQAAPYIDIADIFLEKEEFSTAMDYNQKAIANLAPTYHFEDDELLPPAEAFKNVTDVYSTLNQRAEIIYQMSLKEKGQSAKEDLLSDALKIIDLADEVHANNLKKINVIRGTQSKTLIDRSIDNYEKGLRLAYENYLISGSDNMLLKCFYFTQKMKAQQLWMSFLNSDAKNFANIDLNLVNQERDLLADIAYYENKAREAIANQDTLSFEEYEYTYLYKRKESYRKLLREIEAEYPDYYESKYAFIPEDVSSLKEILIGGEVLIEYVVTDSLLYTFVIEKDEPLKVYQTEIHKDFNQKIQQLSNLLYNSPMVRQSSRMNFIELSHQLYQVLIEPIADDIMDKNRLIIIGDKLMNYIPFEVLVHSNELKKFNELDYLIQSYEVIYHYSSTLFAKARNSHIPAGQQLYAFAPVYDSPTNSLELSFADNNLRAFNEDGVLVPLPESEKEVKSITQLFQNKGIEGAVMAIRQQATEASLKKQLVGKFKYIHIAGHSFADLENPNFSGVACYLETTVNEEDGVLYSGEIYGLSTSADLVTLSSCESGLGKLDNAEGLLGLNRAFIYAGTPNVIYSLWKVYDKVSANLMIDFYEGVLTDKPYATSLREAKLKLLSNDATASPHYWSAYLLIGR